MMTKSIGEQLKEIRESRDVSLEEIAQKTKIRLDYLKALETGEEDALPSVVQLRGFLRLYASELGVKISDLEVKGYHLTEVKPSPLPSIPTDEKVPIPEKSVDFDRNSPERKETKLSDDEKEFPALEDKQGRKKPPEFEAIQVLAPSIQVFLAIGKLLKDRREMLSLSIKEIHEMIYIPEKYLMAMESGQFDQLPSPVQARGMLQNYAEFLNLETDSILLAYADSLQSRRKERQILDESTQKQAAKEISPTRLKLKSFFTLDLLVITAIFIIFAGFVIWGVNRILSVDSPNADATDLPEVSDILLATGSPTPQQTTTSLSFVEEATPEVTIQEEATPLFTPRPNNNPINIVIIPRQRVWVQVTSDLEIVYEGRLMPGNAYDYSGQETVEVLTGNAGALQIYFNEQDTGALGVIGQVVDLIFTRAGLVLPTATNTPTITQTPQATPTPTITPSPSMTPSITPLSP